MSRPVTGDQAKIVGLLGKHTHTHTHTGDQAKIVGLLGKPELNGTGVSVGTYSVETYRYECALPSTKRIALRPKNLGWVTGDGSLCARWGTGDALVHEFLQDSEKVESFPVCACGCGVGTRCLQRRTYGPPLTSFLKRSQGLGKLFAALRSEGATHAGITLNTIGESARQ